MATVIDQPELVQLNGKSHSHSNSQSRLSSSKSMSSPVSPSIPENQDIDSKSIDDVKCATSRSSAPTLNNINVSNESIDDNSSVTSAKTVSFTTSSNTSSPKKKRKKTTKSQSTRVTSKNTLDTKSKSKSKSKPNSSSSNKQNKYYRNLKNRSRSSSNKNDIEIHAKRRYKLDDDRIGICQFIGQTSFAKGIWVGMVIENDDGNTNGTIYGRKYFTCREGKGLFVRPNKIIEALERYIH